MRVIHNLTQGSGQKLKEDQVNLLTIEVPKDCNIMSIVYIFPEGKDLYHLCTPISGDNIDKYKEDYNE